MAKSLEKDKYVDIAAIKNAQKSFQVALFSSIPFIDKSVYESLSTFGSEINNFNYSRVQSHLGASL